MSRTLVTLGRLIGATVPPEAGNIEITGIAALENAAPGDLSFLSNPKYHCHLDGTRASAVILSHGVEVPPPVVPLYVDNPYLAFLAILAEFDTRTPLYIADGVHEHAFIAPTARLGGNVSVGPFAVIGPDTEIGDDTTIGAGSVVMRGASVGSGCLVYPNVTIMDGCRIGDRVTIHAGAVIGSDGFGFAPSGGRLKKIPQIGIVRIEDDVEIGAGTCIDRATFGETVVRQGAKLDNLIQVAHNVTVGSYTVIASQTGISGSTHIGDGVQIGGQAGFAGHLSVGDGASVGAQAGVTKDVPEGETVSGYPAKHHMTAMRLEAALRRLPALLETVRSQERRIQELERLLKEKS